jgi:Fur family ferric uptake transcriptional regulator
VFQNRNSKFGQAHAKAPSNMISSTQTNHPLYGEGTATDAQSRFQAAMGRLRESGLRITQPRIAIIRALISQPKPVSIDQIHSELNIRSCDLVTVYRCLAAFEDIGLVKRSFFHNGTSLYHLADRKNAVYHVISKETEEIRDLDVQTSTELAAAIKKVEDQLKAEGYENVGHVLEFFAKSPAPTPNRGIQAGVQVPVAPL